MFVCFFVEILGNCIGMRMFCLLDTSFLTLFSTKLLSELVFSKLCLLIITLYYCCCLRIVKDKIIGKFQNFVQISMLILVCDHVSLDAIINEFIDVLLWFCILFYFFVKFCWLTKTKIRWETTILDSMH